MNVKKYRDRRQLSIALNLSLYNQIEKISRQEQLPVITIVQRLITGKIKPLIDNENYEINKK